MDLIVNSKEFKRTLSHILKFAKDAIRRDEEAIHFFNDNRYLYLETVKAVQLQLRLAIPLVEETSQFGDFYIHKVWLEQLLSSLTQEENINLVLLNNSLNLISQTKGSLSCELYANESAHDGMRLFDVLDQKPSNEIQHLPEILKKMNSKEENVTFLFEEGQCTVSTSFDQAAYLMLKTECSDLELNLEFCVNQAHLAPLNFLNDLHFMADEDEEGRSVLLFGNQLGYYVIVNSDDRDYELDVAHTLLEQEPLSVVQIPCVELEAAVMWQSYKCTHNDSLSWFVSDSGQCFHIDGPRSVESAQLNCISQGNFTPSAVNLKTIELAAKLLTHNQSQIVDLKQCAVEVQGESDSILYYIINDQITNSFSINLLFYSSVLNE